MEFNQCVRGRRSVRKYKPDPVAAEALERIVAHAAYAPSWKHTQTTRYMAIQDKALKQQLADTCMTAFPPNQAIVRQAPAVIVVTAITGRSGFERDGSFSTGKGAHWESFDAGVATQTLCLAAYDEGLGTVILGIYDEDKVIELLQVPPGQRVSAIVAVGTPDEAPTAPKRKEINDLLTWC